MIYLFLIVSLGYAIAKCDFFAHCAKSGKYHMVHFNKTKKYRNKTTL